MWWSKACFPFRMPYFLLLCRVWVWLQSRVWWVPSRQLTREIRKLIIFQNSAGGGRAISESRNAPCFHLDTFFCFGCEQWPVDPGDFLGSVCYIHTQFTGELFWPWTNASPNEWGFYASCHDSFLVMKLPVVTLIHQGNPRWGNSLFDGFPIKESLSIVKTDNTTGIELSIYIISEKLQKTYQSK